jgi:hypothetical protein
MGFFDDVISAPHVRSEPQRQTVRPARFGPPEGWVLPVVLPAVRVLGTSDNARIALVGLRCWPDGVTLTVQLMRRVASDPEAAPHNTHLGFRLGARFSDGRRAVAAHLLLRTPPADDGPAGPNPILRSVGGGGGRFHRCAEFYLWPLPPRGRLTLVADWAAEEIPETSTELDAGDIRSAAARAVVVWADLPKEPSE